jgi:hypothetical protein
MALFFSTPEVVSLFNDPQIWLAYLFLETKAIKLACSVALAEVGHRRLQNNLYCLLETYVSDLRDQIQRKNECEISCAQTVSSV